MGSPVPQRRQTGTAGIRVPNGLLAAWFPGAALPLDVSLQLEVDGTPWGLRFPSRIGAERKISQGLYSFRGLQGCPIVAFRRAGSPAPALDLALSSLAEPLQRADGQGQQGPRRAAEAADLEAGFWPVVSAWLLA